MDPEPYPSSASAARRMATSALPLCAATLSLLLLRFFGNMTQSQIAAELGISQMHVSRLLARTLAQLRDGLTAEE